MIGDSREEVSRKATDGMSRPMRLLDGLTALCSRQVLNATVDYWFKAMEHQNALRL